MTDHAIDDWKRAGESGDADLAATALAADAVLISPLTDGFSFQGREEIRDLLASAFTVLDGIRFDGDVRDGDQVVLFATATVRGRALTECQRLRLDGDGLIRELTIFLRPLPAVTAFTRALGPVLARAQGRAGTARVLTAAGALLDGVATSGDRTFMPMAAPTRLRD
ncbi:MAG: nuclear transport factor 2 family protein [Microbacterium sp.]|nr:nuclear transport factor 2 family protein [Microbacterium sp.]